MNTTQNPSHTYHAANTYMFTNNTLKVFEAIKENKVVRAAGYLAVGVTGLLLLGGLFRVMAWTVTGYNQFSSALRNKKG